jgi:hypothetical protein
MRTHLDHHRPQRTEFFFEELVSELPAAELPPGLVSVYKIDDYPSYQAKVPGHLRFGTILNP